MLTHRIIDSFRLDKTLKITKPTINLTLPSPVLNHVPEQRVHLFRGVGIPGVPCWFISLQKQDYENLGALSKPVGDFRCNNSSWGGFLQPLVCTAGSGMDPSHLVGNKAEENCCKVQPGLLMSL